MAVANQLETALKSLLTTAGLSNINTGQSAEDLDAADFVCQAEQGEEVPLDSGNYRVRCRVMVRTPADKDNDGTSHLSDHTTAFDSVRTALDTDDLASRLKTAGVGHVFANSIGERAVGSGLEGRLWVSRWEFSCVACESALA